MNICILLVPTKAYGILGRTQSRVRRIMKENEIQNQYKDYAISPWS